jgi:hypothetical protein
MKLLGIISVGFDIRDQQLIRTRAKLRWEECNPLCITYNSLLKHKSLVIIMHLTEILYNIPTDFGVPMKLVRLIKICLNEMYGKVHIGKHLFDNFPIKNGPIQGEALLLL